MGARVLDPVLVAELHAEAGADRWNVEREDFAEALESSLAKAFAGREPPAPAVEQYLRSLRLADLALACACVAGHEAAWQHVVLTLRPVLYRAADALSPARGREMADSLYAELYGLELRGGQRRSLFRYYHGRSSLATWLRAVLAQRHVDLIRTSRRTTALADEADAELLRGTAPPPDPESARFIELMRAALAWALAQLVPTDRLRIACYYAQQMTLAQIGVLVGEHEATVSRQLSRTRTTLRSGIETYLAREHHLDASAIDACFRAVVADTGPLDLRDLLGEGPAPAGAGTVAPATPAATRRKVVPLKRSEGESPS